MLQCVRQVLAHRDRCQYSDVTSACGALRTRAIFGAKRICSECRALALQRSESDSGRCVKRCGRLPYADLETPALRSESKRPVLPKSDKAQNIPGSPSTPLRQSPE